MHLGKQDPWLVRRRPLMSQTELVALAPPPQLFCFDVRALFCGSALGNRSHPGSGPRLGLSRWSNGMHSGLWLWEGWPPSQSPPVGLHCPLPPRFCGRGCAHFALGCCLPGWPQASSLSRVVVLGSPPLPPPHWAGRQAPRVGPHAEDVQGQVGGWESSRRKREGAQCTWPFPNVTAWASPPRVSIT